MSTTSKPVQRLKHFHVRREVHVQLQNFYTRVSVSTMSTPGTRVGTIMAANDFPVSWEQWPVHLGLSYCISGLRVLERIQDLFPRNFKRRVSYICASVLAMTAYRGRGGKASRIVELNARWRKLSCFLLSWIMFLWNNNFVPAVILTVNSETIESICKPF